MLQFWNSAGILITSIESRLTGGDLSLCEGAGRLILRVPFLPLAAGYYRIAGGVVPAEFSAQP